VEHTKALAIIKAIKKLPLYENPQTFFQSEIAECYSDEELISEFAMNEDGTERSVEEAVEAVLYRCELRNDVYGWIIEEGDRERGGEY
jgi:hypothetical protein